MKIFIEFLLHAKHCDKHFPHVFLNFLILITTLHGFSSFITQKWGEGIEIKVNVGSSNITCGKLNNVVV